jgi:hypothetical protein
VLRSLTMGCRLQLSSIRMLSTAASAARAVWRGLFAVALWFVQLIAPKLMLKRVSLADQTTLRPQPIFLPPLCAMSWED